MYIIQREQDTTLIQYDASFIDLMPNELNAQTSLTGTRSL